MTDIATLLSFLLFLLLCKKYLWPVVREQIDQQINLMHEEMDQYKKEKADLKEKIHRLKIEVETMDEHFFEKDIQKKMRAWEEKFLRQRLKNKEDRVKKLNIFISHYQRESKKNILARALTDITLLFTQQRNHGK